jgi:uncharacterized protein (TIGR00369 family)
MDKQKPLNPVHIKEIMRLINKGPYFQLLSMEVVELDYGYSKVVLDLDTKHLNPFGVLHGGVFASIIDTAAFWACYSDLPENAGLISIDLNVSNLATTKDRQLIAEGRRLKTGRTICFAEATVVDGRGKLLAHGTSKSIVTDGLQSINQAVTAAGYQALPSKFFNSNDTVGVV